MTVASGQGAGTGREFNAKGSAAALPPGRWLTWRRLPAAAELVTLGAAYGAPSMVRLLLPADRPAAFANAAGLYHAEQVLHLAIEPNLNRLISASGIAAGATGYYYGLLHFIVTPLVLAWLYLCRPSAFAPLRSALVGATAAANIVFWTFPVAPPRFAVRGIADIMVNRDILGSADPHGITGAIDQYAAMPSLHVCWAAWCAAAVVLATRSRWRHIAWLYPLTTAFVVLATGNHFVFDVIGGLAATALGMAAARTQRLPASPVPARRYSPGQPQPEVVRMLSAQAVFEEIFSTGETFQLFCSIAASDKAHGGWERGRIAALVPDSYQDLARQVARHGADQDKHGCIFRALLRTRSLDPLPVPAQMDYTMRLEHLGIGLAHSQLHGDEKLTEHDIITYLAHSRVTEQRASEQMQALRKYTGCHHDVRRAIRLISKDENHLAYCHEELLRLAAAGHRDTIQRTLRATALAEINVYRDVSKAVMARMSHILHWPRWKRAVFTAGIHAIYIYERLGGWRRMASLHMPARHNALGDPAAAEPASA